MAERVVAELGTELVLETAASSASISDGSIVECDSDDRQSTDNAGWEYGCFEFSTAAGGFSAAPTAGAALHVYEQKINSDSNDAPDVDSSYQQDYLFSFTIDPADAQQHLRKEWVPIAVGGAKYWVEWEDGGAGTASIDAGWELRLIPMARKSETVS